MSKLKLNIYSWALSGFSFLMSAFAYIFFVHQTIPGKLFWSLEKSWFDVMFFYFLIALILAVIGLVIGIKRRKMGSRLSGILGIVFPIIVILLAIYSAFGVELSIILRTT